MVGKAHGFIAHAEAISPECTVSHCIIHRQVIAVTRLAATVSSTAKLLL
jgi:hypothetical protein